MAELAGSWLKVFLAEAGQGRGVPCSFCGKPYHQIGPLIEGPHHVFICDTCISEAQFLMNRSKRERGVPLGTTEIIGFHELPQFKPAATNPDAPPDAT
jgi:hypothetical protein